jgi:hypothetical protein
VLRRQGSRVRLRIAAQSQKFNINREAEVRSPATVDFLFTCEALAALVMEAGRDRGRILSDGE